MLPSAEMKKAELEEAAGVCQPLALAALSTALGTLLSPLEWHWAGDSSMGMLPWTPGGNSHCCRPEQLLPAPRVDHGAPKPGLHSRANISCQLLRGSLRMEQEKDTFLQSSVSGLIGSCGQETTSSSLRFFHNCLLIRIQLPGDSLLCFSSTLCVFMAQIRNNHLWASFAAVKPKAHMHRQHEAHLLTKPG